MAPKRKQNNTQQLEQIKSQQELQVMMAEVWGKPLSKNQVDIMDDETDGSGQQGASPTKPTPSIPKSSGLQRQRSQSCIAASVDKQAPSPASAAKKPKTDFFINKKLLSL